MINLKCHRCKHVWTCRGNRALEKGYTACASCKTCVYFKHDKIMLTDNMGNEVFLPDQRSWGHWNKRSIELLNEKKK